MTPLKTVFVIDDDTAVRESLRWLLESVDLRVIEFESGDEFLESFEDMPNSCIIADLRMPGVGGLAVLDELAGRAISPPVIIVTAYGNVSTTARAMRTGAVHVLEKPYDNQELLDTIQEAFEQDERHRTEYGRQAVVTGRLALLTGRKRAVLDLIVAGKSNKMIAHELRVSEKNIEYHRARVYQKMQAENLAALIRMVANEALPERDADPNRP